MMEQEQRPTNIQRLVLRLEELLWRKDFEFCEIVSGLAALGWGFLLLMPWDTYHSSPAFGVFEYFMSEPVLGILMITLGLMQLTALFFEWYKMRRQSCLAASGVWMAISVAIALGNPSGLSIAIYPLFALTSAWAYLRIRRIAL